MNQQESGQNFENHVNLPHTWFVFQIIYILATILGIIAFFSANAIIYLMIGMLLIGIGNIFAFIIVRGYSTKLQDRIIRLEMRIRLEKILPQDMHNDIQKLTIPQLIGLRFASDTEMTDLVKKVISENITDRTPIKKTVTDWQGDYYRV